MDSRPPPDEHFVPLDGNRVVYHRPTGLVVSATRRIVLVPMGRFRLEHPTAMKAIQDSKLDISVYTRLFENAGKQNYVVVADDGLSSVLEGVTVSVCGTCKQYCNTSLTGNGFKDHYRNSVGCGAKTIPNFKMKGFRFFMAKKRCVFVLIGDAPSRSPTPEADVLKTPKGNSFVLGPLGLPTEKTQSLPSVQVSPQERYSTAGENTQRSTTTDPNHTTAQTTTSNKDSTPRPDPLSYPQNTPSLPHANFTPVTSTPKLHQSTLSFSTTKAIDSSNDVSPSTGPVLPDPASSSCFRVPPVPVQPQKITGAVSSHSTPQMRSASLETGSLGGNESSRYARTQLSFAPTGTPIVTGLYEARSRLQIPTATNSNTANLNFTSINNNNKLTPPKRSSTSMSVLPPTKRANSFAKRSETPAINGRTMFGSPEKRHVPLVTYPQPTNPTQAISPTTSQHFYTGQPSKPLQFTAPVINSDVNDILKSAKWMLQQTLFREAHVVNLPATPYVNKLITPGTMENKMISPTLLLQAILTRIRPMNEHGYLVSITGPWGMTITSSSTGLQIDVCVRPASNGPEDMWSIQIKIIYRSTETTLMTTSNELEWTSVSYQIVCTTLVCLTAIMKEIFNSPHTVDVYTTLKTGLPMFAQMLGSHTISGVDVVRGWLNDTMQTGNQRRVTLAGAPLG